MIIQRPTYGLVVQGIGKGHYNPDNTETVSPYEQKDGLPSENSFIGARVVKVSKPFLMDNVVDNPTSQTYTHCTCNCASATNVRSE